MTKPKRLYLIDGHALAYRSYFAFIRNPLVNSKGEDTSAVFGFTSALLKIIREHRPDYLAVVFDTAKPTFRHQLYAEYKSTRVKMPDQMRDQMPRIQQVIATLNIPELEREGFEADDVMASLARQAQEQGLEVVLVTGDKDLLQLVSDRIKVLDPRRGGQDEVLYDQGKVEERFGVPPGRLTDILGLMGDSSDNVPGVPGIGEKTARNLVQQYGDIETVVAHAGEVANKRVRENLEKYAEQARLSKELVQLKTQLDIPLNLEDLQLGEYDASRLAELFRELEFSSLLDRVPVADSHRKCTCTIVSTARKFVQLVKKLRQAKAFVIDLETTSTDPLLAEIVGLAFSIEPGSAFYVPVGHQEGPNMDLQTVLQELGPILADEKIQKCGQNIKYDQMILARKNCPMRGICFDTMVASYLLNPSGRRHNLDLLSMEHLAHKKIPLTDLIGKGKSQKSFAEVPVKLASEYSCEDADCTLRIWRILEERLQEMNLEDLFLQVEMPLVQVLAEMELTGVRLDVKFLQQMSKRLEGELELLVAEIYQTAGSEFNINSPKQLSHVLFDQLELPVVRRTKTGYSTDEAVLEELAREHPLPRKLLDYRQLTKLKSTYVDALPRMVNPRTGRVHTSFNQTITATGRLSSSGPNLQNIPIRTEFSKTIRQAFVASDEDHRIVSADYSQIELRIMAHLSQDPTLLESFHQDRDVHARTAALVFDIPEKKVTPEHRRQAKIVNFGIMYGMSPYGLARQLEIGPKEAGRFIEDYFQLYPGVRQYVEQTVQSALENGYVTTLLNRRRYLPELRSEQSSVAAFARRMAINTPIQGTAADLIKVAMIGIHQSLADLGRKTKMIIQIHDELVFDVPGDELDEVVDMVRSEMEHALTLSIPVKVDVGVGRNWYEAH